MTGPQRRATSLVTVAAWLTLDLVRFSGPLFSQLFDIGVSLAVLAAIAAYVGGSALAWVGGLVARQVGHGTVLTWLALALVVLRVLLPFLSGDVLIIYGFLALALALALLLLALSGTTDVAGGAGALAAAGMGAMIALAEQAILRTWDALWRDDLAGRLAGAILCVALLVAVWRARRESPSRPARGLWAFGLWLSITAFALANAAFLSSQSGYHLGLAFAVGALGLAAGVYTASRKPNVPIAGVAVVAGVALLAVWTMVAFSGPVLLVMIPVASATLTYLASRAVRPAPNPGAAGLRSLGAYAAFGLLTVLPFMLVQLDYDIPLGFPHLLVIVAAAAAITVPAVVRSHASRPGQPLAPATVGFRRRAGIGALASIAIGAFLLATFNTGAGRAGEPPESLRVVSWNLHYGVTPGLTGGPGVELDQTVAYLRAKNPDVLLLQEVERGWILAGGTDLLQYLADALDMNYAYAGAHDRQFGNAILSRYPITDPSYIRLPYGKGPQGRSAIVGTVATASGDIQFVSVHLQHKNDEKTRVDEVTTLLDKLGTAPARMIAGDFNARPDAASVRMMTEAGYVSAQDSLFHEQNTYVGSDFQARIDYQFLDGVRGSDFAIGDSTRSDHLDLSEVVSVK